MRYEFKEISVEKTTKINILFQGTIAIWGCIEYNLGGSFICSCKSDCLFFYLSLRRFTMENLQAQQAPALQYAGVGIRFLALLIDAVIIGVVGGILNAVASATGSSSLVTIVEVVVGI